MYHLLALYLSTPHPSTRSTVSTLITRLLSSSVLFEHDPSEIAIWLESFDMTIPSTLTATSPILSNENEILLQFFDDSLRRCLKTPYKYIEDSLHFLSNETPLAPSEVSSPLLLTILEQLNAKLRVKLLEPQDANVIVRFIERLGFGLVGKQRDLAFGLELVKRIESNAGVKTNLKRMLDTLVGRIEPTDEMKVDEGKRRTPQPVDQTHVAPK